MRNREIRVEIVSRAKNKHGQRGQILTFKSIAEMVFKFSEWSKQVEWEPVYSDAYVITNAGDRKRVKLPLWLFCLLFFEGHWFVKKQSDSRVLYPFPTKKGMLSFSFRGDNGFTWQGRYKQLIAGAVAEIVNVIKPYGRSILVFEKESNRAQDNAFTFFKYAVQQDEHYYFLIHQDSPDIKNTEGQPNIVYFGSFKHFYMLYRSKLFVSSETSGHAYYWRQNMGITAQVVRTKPYVFLQHGVLGFKKLDAMLHAKKLSAPIGFVTSSDFESKIVSDFLGYEKNQILTTGLTRWDAIDLSKSREKEFIVAFYTWRPWLDDVSEKVFLESEYFNNIKSSVGNLQRMVEHKNLKQQVVVVAHPKMQRYLAPLASKSKVKIWTDIDGPINEVMNNTALMVTDYSSIAWEAYYRNIPVLFDQFDLGRYSVEVGGYIDLCGNLPFGNRLTSQTLQQTIDSDFELSKQDKKNKPIFFKYEDQDATKRTFDAVQNFDLRYVKARKRKVLKRAIKKLLNKK